MTVASTQAANDAERLGVQRSLDPSRALPHMARVLDAGAPANAFEAEIDVELLNVDATSFTEIRRRCDGDPGRMARTIREIVDAHGFLAVGQECACHLADPAYLAVLARGGTVTWLEINGPGATRRELSALLAAAP